MKDGWHMINGCQIYVEDNLARRGIKLDRNGEEVTAWIYKWEDKYGLWNHHAAVEVPTLRKGLKEGRYALM